MLAIDKDALEKLRKERREARAKMQQPDQLVDVLRGIEEQLEDLRHAILIIGSNKRR